MPAASGIVVINNGKAFFVSIQKWSLGADWLIAAGAYPGFCSMKRLGVFLLPLDGMLVHRRSPSPGNLLGFPNNSPVPIYTPGWREALWELSVLPKNTTQCPRSGTARSGDERTNHEALAPPLLLIRNLLIFAIFKSSLNLNLTRHWSENCCSGYFKQALSSSELKFI